MIWILKLLILSLMKIHSSFAAPKIETFDIPLYRPDHPVYDHRTNHLYFVDSTRIYCYNEAKNKYTWADAGGLVGPLVPTKSNSSEFIAGIDNRLEQFAWNGISPIMNRVVYSTVGEDSITRYNDGQADKMGRLWFTTEDVKNGTILTNQASLMNITRENKMQPTAFVYHIYNEIRGFAFSKSSKHVYYAVPSKNRIIKHNYNTNNASLTNPSTIFDLLKQQGNVSSNVEISGIAMDTSNCLWVTLFDVDKVYKISTANGKILKEIIVPARYVTNLAFGGKNMMTLYVTAFTNKSEQAMESGKIYAITGLEAKGVQTFTANIS